MANRRYSEDSGHSARGGSGGKGNSEMSDHNNAVQWSKKVSKCKLIAAVLAVALIAVTAIAIAFIVLYATAQPPKKTTAVCAMISDMAAAVGDRKNITGTVHLIQTEGSDDTEVIVDLQGVEVGSQPDRGLHVHTEGKVEDGCAATGGHYDPHKVNHGSRDSSVRHPGDFGNVQVNANGDIKVKFTVDNLKLSGDSSVIGRGMVLHGGKDDLGLGSAPTSKSSGDSGPRIACCQIRLL